MKVCVLLSGGQDSTTCFLWAVKKFGQENVLTVSFDYGQRHIQELTQVMRILEMFPKVKKKVFSIHGVLPEAALTNETQDINANSTYDTLLPASFVPGRNILFFTLAASYAAVEGCHRIISGVCETDYSGYPDCRSNFVHAMEKALSLGLDKPLFEIITPLMDKTKADIWSMAKNLGAVDGWDAFEIVRTMTMTDYNGDMTFNEWGYGKEDNPASILRAEGYRKAKENGWI